MSYKNCIHNYNLATECGLTTDMTELEICTAIAEWVNNTIDYMTAEVVTITADSKYMVHVWLNSFSAIKACWGSSSGTYFRCYIYYNNCTYNTLSTSTSTTQENAYSVIPSSIGMLNFMIIKSAYGCLFGFFNKYYSRTNAMMALVSTCYGDGHIIGIGKSYTSSSSSSSYVVSAGNTTSSSNRTLVLGTADSNNKCLTRLMLGDGDEIAEHLYMTNNVQQTGTPYVIDDRYFVDFYPCGMSGYTGIAMEIVEGDNDVLYQTKE